MELIFENHGYFSSFYVQSFSLKQSFTTLDEVMTTAFKTSKCSWTLAFLHFLLTTKLSTQEFESEYKNVYFCSKLKSFLFDSSKLNILRFRCLGQSFLEWKKNRNFFFILTNIHVKFLHHFITIIKKQLSNLDMMSNTRLTTFPAII